MRTGIFYTIVSLLVMTLVWLFFAEHHTFKKLPTCGTEKRQCANGSFVHRVAPQCDFAPCTDSTQQTPELNPPQEKEPFMVACTMDAKICPDGSAVGRVAPNCEFAPCPTLEEEIRVDAPESNTSISSPVTITGTARGNWFFEGSFPVSIVNWDGRIIGQGIAQAQGEWMTEDFVPFTATLSYTFASNTPYNRGAIILKKDNPSGLPQNDASIEIPVTFSEINQ